MQRLHFIAGLPRTGSTLLCNILLQHPDFHATSTSGLPSVLMMLRNQWDKLPEMAAAPNAQAKVNCLRAVLRAFHSSTPKPVIFDKSRTWPRLIETVEAVTGEPVKIIACVRNVLDILSSLEKVYRRDSALLQPAGEGGGNPQMTTVLGRCRLWSDVGAVLGSAYFALKDAIDRGYRDRFFFLEFNDLTRRPDKALADLHNWLDLSAFNYDFANVEQITQEDDRAHGFGIGSLHTIRRKVEPVRSDWREILGAEAFETYRNQEFWQRL